MQLKRVVVTGLGALSPIGNNVKTFWNALLQGQSGAEEISKFDASNFKTRFACEVKGFDPLTIMNRREARRMDLFSQYAIAASEEAIIDAGLKNNDAVNKDRIGVIWSSGIGGIITFEKEVYQHARNSEPGAMPRFNPLFIPKMISDIASGHISIRNGFKGVNYAIVSACASSAHALLDAYHYICLGKADAIIAGGSEAAISEGGIGGFNALRALSQRNDDPKTASRPFDAERDGFVMGEGAAGIVLESYEHAVNRGARIYAELVGGAASADAYHITAPHPEGEGAMRVMREALADAGMKGAEIDYINVHGTSTPLGDLSEVKALQHVFGEDLYNINISSTKSMTGHLLGAAGALEALASIMAIKEGKVPPTINHFTPDPNIDQRLNFTFHKAQERTVNAALSNNFGFGGHNASLIFKKISGV